MPSARQIANGLRRRGISQGGADAIGKMAAAAGGTPEETAAQLRKLCTRTELQAAREIIANILSVMDDIERTNIPVLTGADVRRRSTRKELESEQ